MTRRRKQEKAHRIAYELAYGVSPGKLQVIHSCDNPPCCNPNHLSLGTSQDNHDDMVAKGRQTSGEKDAMHKLTEELVNHIRERYAHGGISQAQLARETNMSVTQIWRVVHYYNWKECNGSISIVL